MPLKWIQVKMASKSPSQKPAVLFYSYSHNDEKFRNRLAKHLAILRRLGVIKEWYDRDIEAGEEWRETIDEHVETADIIVLLVSADFIASDYCWDKELARALERHNEGTARVIPIIVQPVDWTGAPFGRLQALPENGKPVTRWSNREEAWTNIAKSIRKVAEAHQQEATPELTRVGPLVIPTLGEIS
jgi:TIR domain